MKGRLIAFEGIDGAGKTTQARLVEEWLVSKKYPVIYLKEPTDGINGKKIQVSAKNGRFSVDEELELFLQDRRENVDNNILPNLKLDRCILIDRYYFSTIAYQSARGLDPEEIRRKNEAFAPRPDLVLLFDLDPEIALDRIREKRGESPNLFEKLEYLRQVRENFLKLSDPFIRRIDASLSIEDVWLQVKEAIEPLFPGKSSP